MRPLHTVHPTRRGFTLVELLIVVTIMLLLAAAATPVALTLLNGRSLREASSSVQAVLAGARDRASAAREVRGVRLITDNNDQTLVRELRFVRPSTPLMTGSAIVVDAVWQAPWGTFSPSIPASPASGPVLASSSWTTNSAPPPLPQFTMVVLLGCTDGYKLQSLPYLQPNPNNRSTRYYFGTIRMATSGQVLGFTTTDALIINGGGFPLLRLDVPMTRPYPYDFQHPGQLPYSSAFPPGVTADDLAKVGDNYSIPIGNVELEGETPIMLPTGVVIDLGYIPPGNPGNPPAVPAVAGVPDPSDRRLSRLQPEYTNWDIMFGPTGAVVGSAATDAHIFLWLREERALVQDLPVAAAVAPSGMLRMIPTNNSGNHSVVAIVSRTGLIRSVEPNFGALQGGAANATMDADGTTTGPSFAYWNRFKLYDLFFSELNAPDGGETGL